MELTDNQQQTMIAKQIHEWTAELTRLAGQIAAAKGTQCALVMISGSDPEYLNVVPELILDDVLRVNPYGWPKGFNIDLLNPSK